MYKLLHTCNLLTTNISVSKWDKNNSGNCDFCDTQENIKHLIFECDLIKPIWSKISQLIKIDMYKCNMENDCYRLYYFQQQKIIHCHSWRVRFTNIK